MVERVHRERVGQDPGIRAERVRDAHLGRRSGTGRARDRRVLLPWPRAQGLLVRVRLDVRLLRTLLSVGLSLVGTAVGRELVARRMSVRGAELDRAETGIEERLEELDPFARVQLIGRLAQREAARYGLGKAA